MMYYYTLEQISEITHIDLTTWSRVVRKFGMFKSGDTYVIPPEMAVYIFNIKIVPDKPVSRILETEIKKYMEERRGVMQIERSKRGIIIRGINWEVEARREILKPSTWAVVFNNKFLAHVEAQTGEGAILKCFEVPAHVRKEIKKKLSKKGK